MERPLPNPQTEADLREELTKLEFAASQGKLNDEGKARLEQLRRQHTELKASAKERMERPTQADAIVMKGDDSP